VRAREVSCAARAVPEGEQPGGSRRPMHVVRRTPEENESASTSDDQYMGRQVRSESRDAS
jgi:hypothetical protein